MKTGLKLRHQLSLKPKLKHIARIRLASFIQLSEKKFSESVIEVENDPVFKRLISPDNAELRVITCKTFNKTSFQLNSLPIKEQISGEGEPIDVETLLAGKADTVALIKKIGLEKFEKYFLDCAAMYPVSVVSNECGLSEKDVVNINEFVNDLSVRSEFYHPSTLRLQPSLNYAKIAEISYDGKGDFVINFFSPKYISGRYAVNNTRLNALKKQNAFSREEISKINKLIVKIELINERKSTIYQILRKIIEVQKNYLYSGEEKFLVPYTQRKLSLDIGLDNSVVCRAIYGRSLVTPHNTEKPLKFFVPNEKDVRKSLIRKIISSERNKLTDNKIVQILKDDFGITVSRRTINVCRNEILEKR